jgi:hypothetical protein
MPIGKLVKSNSSMKWVPFMIRYEVGKKFFGLIKKYNYYYVHPSIPELPKNLYEMKIGNEVEFYFVEHIHARFPLDSNGYYVHSKSIKNANR